MNKINSYQKLSVIFVIILLGTIFHYKYVNEFPSHIHAWAQADRYALSIGFVNNNLNFFKPETFVYNHQFPYDWQVPSSKTITAVDFPIHDYIPAIFMKTTGVIQPWFFRVYVLLYSFIGLYFLFQLAFFITKNFYKSLFAVIFAATSPVFVYYQSGMLPTIPSLANAIIGLFFYVKYFKNNTNKYFNLSILFLTLATLSRSTFAIPLIAVLGLEFLRIFKHSDIKIKSKIIPVLLSFGSIFFYILYNNYLRNKYGSIFLNHLMPPSNFEHAFEIIKTVKEKWLTSYFSNIHYVVFAVLIVLSIIFFFTYRKKQKDNKLQLNILMLTSIILIGDILFFIVMMRQFPNHDYYFLDTFYITFILLTIIVLSVIPDIKYKYGNFIYIALIAAFILPVAKNIYGLQKQKRFSGYWDRVQTTIDNFKGSDKFLDSLGVTDKAKILVIDAYAPNIPFILMNRKGYVVMTTKRKNIETALQWDYDYLVIQNDFFVSDIYSKYPEILSQIKKTGDNGSIYVCKKSKDTVNQSLDDFIGLSKLTPVFSATINYDTIVNSQYWLNVQDTCGIAFSGNKSGILRKDMPFGITYKTKTLSALIEKNRTLRFSSYFMQDSIQDCKIIISISQDGNGVFYKSYSLKDFMKNTNSWEHVEFTCRIPKISSDNYEFALYLWNTDKAELLIDNFGFDLF